MRPKRKMPVIVSGIMFESIVEAGHYIGLTNPDLLGSFLIRNNGEGIYRNHHVKYAKEKNDTLRN